MIRNILLRRIFVGDSKKHKLSKEKGWIHKLQERTSKRSGRRGANANPFCKYKLPNTIIFQSNEYHTKFYGELSGAKLLQTDGF